MSASDIYRVVFLYAYIHLQIASQLLQSLQDKETSSQRVLPVNQMDVIAKRFDDVDQQMQRALDHIKQISVVLDEMKDGQKDMMGMDTIIERVSDAVLAFHAAKAHNKQDDGDGCFGETGARKRCDPNADDSDTLKHVVLKERMRKKCKKETVMFHASSQESCSSHR